VNKDLQKTVTKSSLVVRAVLVSSLLVVSLLISHLWLNELDWVLFSLMMIALLGNIVVLGVSVYVLFKYSYQPFSPIIKILVRYYFYGTLLSWFLWMPLLVGLGMGQFFFLLSGIMLYVLPAWLIVYFEKIKWWFVLPQKSVAKPWHLWMKEQPFNRDESQSKDQKMDEVE
jgi:hypothetical protein